MFIYPELQSHKFLASGNVLQGDMPGPPLNVRRITAVIRFRDLSFGIRVIAGPGDAGHLFQQIPRVQIRFRDPRVRKPVSSLSVSFLKRHRFSFCQVRQSKTSSTARIPTSIMSSSGSLVVIFWTQRPGWLRTFIKTLSVLPARRMIS